MSGWQFSELIEAGYQHPLNRPAGLPANPGIAGGRSRLSPATLDDHEGDTVGEHEFVNMLSPSWSSAGVVMLSLAA